PATSHPLNRARGRRRYPRLQCATTDQLAVVGEGQLLGRIGEFLITDHDALRAVVVACAGDHLLDGRDADGPAEALALHRHRPVVAPSDQVDTVIAAARGEADLPAGPLKARGDIV